MAEDEAADAYNDAVEQTMLLEDCDRDQARQIVEARAAHEQQYRGR